MARHRRPVVLERRELDGLDAAHVGPRRLEREHVVQDERERVDVDGAAVGLVPEDLGRHEAVRAGLARHRVLIVARRVDAAVANRAQLGEPEVGHLERVREVEQQVGRLEVAVDDRRLARVQVVHALRKLDGVAQRARRPQHAGRRDAVDARRLEHVVQRAAHQLADHDLAVVGERVAEQQADVRVAQLAEQPHLLPKVGQRGVARLGGGGLGGGPRRAVRRRGGRAALDGADRADAVGAAVLGRLLGLEHLGRDERAAPPALPDVAKCAGADLLDDDDVAPLDRERVDLARQQRRGRRRGRRRSGEPGRLAGAAGDDEQSLARAVARLTRVVERAVAPPVLGVDVGTRCDERLHRRVVPFAAREVQRRPQVVVVSADGGAVGEQRSDLVDLATARSEDERGAVVGHAEPTADAPQVLGHVGVALAHGVVERAAAPSVALVWAGTLADQELDDFEMAIRRGNVERASPVVVAEAQHQRLCRENALHLLLVVGAARAQEIAAKVEVLVGHYPLVLL